MKIKDCHWEERNLGSKVIEIDIETSDVYQDFDASKLTDFDYCVVKVPVNMPEFNLNLTSEGFTMIELQMDMALRMIDFNYNEKLLKWVTPYVTFDEVTSASGFEELKSRITPGMFSTDRISLDPFWGPKIGCNRYINWIKDELNKNSSRIIWILYKEKKVGFMMFKEGVSMRGLLGGLFKEFQEMGLGLLTPCSLPLFVKQESLPVKRILADISSNNAPVWDLYEHFGYKATNPHYVYIKHLNK